MTYVYFIAMVPLRLRITTIVKTPRQICYKRIIKLKKGLIKIVARIAYCQLVFIIAPIF